jgi:EAL domain-containing protein (putative c-di-GMP-specific phosphodiesterase class I)
MLTARLRTALERGEFTLQYQPIYNLADGRPVSVEALIRWVDAKRGLVMPLEFVPIAEYTGLIEPIGDWVMGRICAQARAWRDQGFDGSVSFNASLRQLQPERFAGTLERALAEAGLEPSAVTVEITESTAMRDPSCIEPVLAELCELGVTIAIDDFGTGYSSLSRLQHMPVQILKIDRSFLEQVPDREHATRIVGATIDLAAALGMTAVAEGIETEEQRLLLIERGCPSGQGFHLARPLAAEEATALLVPGSRARS